MSKAVVPAFCAPAMKKSTGMFCANCDMKVDLIMKTFKMVDYNQGDRVFAREEFDRVALSDADVQLLCVQHSQVYLPSNTEAAPIIASRIRKFLTEGQAASLVRVGNAEGSALRLTYDPIHPTHFKIFNDVFSSQNGCMINEIEARAFCHKIRRALMSADIVGFRTIDSNVRGPELALILRHISNGNVEGALGLIYARQFLQDMLSEGRLLDRILTSAWIHLALIPFLTEIMDAADRIIVITGRPELGEAFAKRLGARLQSFITVPVEGFRPHDPTESHYGDVCQSVINVLKQDLRGTLILIGAGLFGKIYCHAAKISGAVAIDLGSTFDLLAGVTSRPAHSAFDIISSRWI
jgi:hypothetical protein